MTTIAAGRLSETLQSLVDARLDTIDRMLLGRVNRHDRLAIVREVETQIFDLLGSRDSESLDRDDVLAVLARLDPPEAYLPDEATGETGRVRVSAPAPVIRPASGGQRHQGLISGVLGIVGLTLHLIPILLMFGAFQNFPNFFVFTMFFGTSGLIFLLGLIAVINAACLKLRGGWTIAGFVTGIIAMLTGLFWPLLELIQG